MTLITGINRSRDRGFTLIELILVMALLIVTASLVTPTLIKFFGGRDVDSEVRRFFALIHYGQARAVGDGVPMMLWVDSANRSYGLEQVSGYADKDPKAIEHTLAAGLKITVTAATTKAPVAYSQTGRILSGQTTTSSDRKKKPAIYFYPDGSINPLTSVGSICIQNADNAPVWIVPDGSQLSYEISYQNPIRR